MYSIVLAMALAQAPAGQEAVVTPAPRVYSGTVQSAPVRERRFFRNRRMGRRTYDGRYGSQPVMSGDTNYRSYYTGPAPTEPAPATMIVHLPPNAALKVDGAETKSTSATRVFETPPLEPGKDYTYELTAQLPGSDVTTTQVVRVRPGQATEVVINFPTGDRRSDGANQAPRRRIRR